MAIYVIVQLLDYIWDCESLSRIIHGFPDQFSPLTFFGWIF